jgi:hypothetical protein
VGSGGEPGNVTNDNDQPGGARGAHAMQAHQAGAAGSDQFREFLVGYLPARVSALEVGDQLGADPRRALPEASRGRTLASRALAWAADKFFFAPGMSSSSSVELRHHARAALVR